MEEELSHPLTRWKSLMCEGGKIAVLASSSDRQRALHKSGIVSTVCIAAATPAALCFARLTVSHLVPQTRSSLLEFSKRRARMLKLCHVLPNYRCLQDRLLVLEVESQRRQSSAPVRWKQKLDAISRLKLSTTAALLPS